MNYSKSEITSLFILLIIFSCDNRSKIQIEESEALYECMCDNLAIDRAIENFRNSVDSYYPGGGFPQEFLYTNSCYLELLAKQEQNHKIYEEKMVELQKLNFGYIEDDEDREDSDLGYIKGSDFDIHIIKPAKRALAKYCRDVYKLDNDYDCFPEYNAEREQLWLKPDVSSNMTKPSNYLISQSISSTSAGFLKNGFFNWFKTIQNNRLLEEDFLHFTDSGIYSVNMVEIQDTRKKDSLKFGLSVATEPLHQVDGKEVINIPIAVEDRDGFWFPRMTKGFQTIAEDEEGNLYAGIALYDNFRIYKLDFNLNEYELYFEFKISDYHDETANDRSILLPQLIFLDNEIHVIYNNVPLNNDSKDRIIFSEHLIIDKKRNFKVVAINELMGGFLEGTPSRYIALTDLIMIDDSEVLINLIGESPRNRFGQRLLVSYSLNDEKVTVLNKETYHDDEILGWFMRYPEMNNERQEWVSSKVMSSFFINDESEARCYWHIARINEEAYEVYWSLEGSNEWNSFILPIVQ